MKAFVFDLDNTLFDRYGTFELKARGTWERIKPYINPAYSFDTALKHFCAVEQLYIYKMWPTVFEELVRANFFDPRNVPTYARFMKWWCETNLTYAAPYPYALPVLKDIKAAGYKLGLITNGSPVDQLTKLKLLGLDEIFDVTLVAGAYAVMNGSHETDNRYYKPHKCIFDYFAELIGLPPCEMYYVGDSPTNDVRGSREAGYVPIWIRSDSPWPYDMSEMPELNYKTVEGLRELL